MRATLLPLLSLHASDCCGRTAVRAFLRRATFLLGFLPFTLEGDVRRQWVDSTRKSFPRR